MPTPAAQRRFDAIGVIVANAQRADRNYRAEPTERDSIAEAIDALAPLGRTERWQHTIAEWAKMVREETHLDWAITQGAVYAGWAAE